jgi:hypothetical protein
MKRLLLFIPIAFLFFVNSCTEFPRLTDGLIATALAETQIAQTRAAVPTQTFNPTIFIMVDWLNADLMSSTNALSSTLDAKYNVTDITYKNNSPMTFRIEVTCICMNNADCCIPERTFVVILESLKRNSSTALSQVPADVSQMMVVCSDKANSPIGAITVSWQAVKEYLLGHLSGYQLGVQVTRTGEP